MGKTFRKMSSYDGSNKISRDDFYLALRELGIILNKTDIEVFKIIKKQKQNFQKLKIF